MEEIVTLAEMGLYRYVPNIVRVRLYACRLQECHSLKQVLQNVIFYMLLNEELIAFKNVIKKDFYKTIEPFIQHICSHIPTTTWRDGIWRIREQMKGSMECWPKMVEKEARYTKHHATITANRKMKADMTESVFRLRMDWSRLEPAMTRPIVGLATSRPDRKRRVGDVVMVELPVTAPVPYQLEDDIFPRRRLFEARRARRVVVRKSIMGKYMPSAIAEGSVACQVLRDEARGGKDTERI